MVEQSREDKWVEQLPDMLEGFGHSMYQCGVIGEGLYNMSKDFAEFKNISADEAAMQLGLSIQYGEIESLKNLGIKL
jgi:hypothetical protein